MNQPTQTQASALIDIFKWLQANHKASNPTTASLLLRSRAAFMTASKAQNNDDHFENLNESAETLRRVIYQVKHGQTTFNPVAKNELLKLALSLSESVRKRERLEPPWKPKTKKYRVQRGDTVYRLAKRSGMSKSEFEALNNLPPNAKLKVSQKLLVANSMVVTGIHAPKDKNPVLPLAA